MGGLLGVILAIPLTGVVKSLTEIVLDPALTPQTGEFFNNPFLHRNSLQSELAVVPQGKRGAKANEREKDFDTNRDRATSNE